MDDLTIVIVAWNCRPYLTDCLRSVKAGGKGIAYSIIVVDNNSEDGTVGMLARDFPDVRVIANGENRGFAAANNQGLKEARSRYVMLLNPDTIVGSGALGGLVGFMDAHSGVWAAGPAMLSRDGSLQRTGVRFPDTWNILCEALFLDRLFPGSKIFGRHRELYADMSAPRAVDYVQGACLMVRSEAAKEVGGLDEKFFMYFEETDWCYRMKQRGGEVYVIPQARVTHFGGGDPGHYDEDRLVHYHRGLLRFYAKHCSWLSSFMVRVVLLLRCFIRVIVWTVVALTRPALRTAALSSIRGYLRIPVILVEPPG